MKRAIATVAASSTDATLVAPVTAKKIAVRGLVIVVGGTATAVTINSHKPSGATTALSPAMSLGINGTLVLPPSGDGWFETLAGEGLTVTTGAGSTVGLSVLYDERD